MFPPQTICDQKVTKVCSEKKTSNMQPLVGKTLRPVILMKRSCQGEIEFTKY
jgi:hypothetical protein